MVLICVCFFLVSDIRSPHYQHDAYNRVVTVAVGIRAVRAFFNCLAGYKLAIVMGKCFLFLTFTIFNLIFFIFFSGSDENEVCLFIRQPRVRRFDFVLFNPSRNIINIGNIFMVQLSRTALNRSRGYGAVRNNPMFATWNEVFMFLQSTQRCPFMRFDLRRYDTTARRHR